MSWGSRLGGRGVGVLVGCAWALVSEGCGTPAARSDASPTPSSGLDAAITDARLPGDAGRDDDPDADACTRIVASAHVGDEAALARLEGVVEIEGELHITAGARLDALSCLRRVGGDLTISGARTLVDLQGLDALEEVGGTLVIEVVPQLASLDLPALRRVGGELRLDGLRALVELTGWGRLQAIGGALVLTNNPQLRTLDAFSALSAVGGLVLRFNGSLETVDGFDALTELSGALQLHFVRPVLLPGLARLERVQGDVELGELFGTWGEGLDRLSDVGGVLRFGGDQLQRVRFRGLAQVGGIELSYGQVEEVSLPALREVRGSITLSESGALRQVQLAELHTVTGTLSVRDDTRLERIELDRLARVAGLDVSGGAARPALIAAALEVVDGPLMLASLDTRAVDLSRLSRARTIYYRANLAPARLALPALRRTALVSILDNEGVTSIELDALADCYDVGVRGNGALLRLDLPALTTSAGRLTVTDNPRLEGLEAPRLEGRVQQMVVADNAALDRVRLPAMTDLGSLSIRAHSRLATLDLAALGRVERDFSVVDNLALPTCAATALLDQVQARRGVGAQVEITGNAPCVR